LLVLFDGKPALRSVAQTSLMRIVNTRALMALDPQSGRYYLWLTDRWVEAPAIAGPWTAAASPPAALAELKASVAGSREVDLFDDPSDDLKALLAKGELPAIYVSTGPAELLQLQGEPQLAPIEGTGLLQVTNTPSAVIEVSPTSYYGCENGVWFQASSPAGPWTVAATVPQVIYTIPPSSRLYYVTFVRVYDSTPDVVYVAYTPGYYGSYVAPSGVLVYGTGYWYDPWIGNVWIGPPYTYGFGAGYVWGATSGFVLGFTSGVFF